MMMVMKCETETGLYKEQDSPCMSEYSNHNKICARNKGWCKFDLFKDIEFVLMRIQHVRKQQLFFRNKKSTMFCIFCFPSNFN